MEALINLIIGLIVVAVFAWAAWVLGWRWWLQPLSWAVKRRQWGWALALALGGWWVGFVYRPRYFASITVADPTGYARGDTLIANHGIYRVLDIHDNRLDCLWLGRRTTLRP